MSWLPGAETLSDPALRAEYDASLAVAIPPPIPEYRPPAIHEIKTPVPPSAQGGQRFASERADRDQILRRAIAARVRSAVEAAHGRCETPSVRGFDLAWFR